MKDYKGYGIRLDKSNPDDDFVIKYIENYMAIDRRNNLKYLLIDLIHYRESNQSVIEHVENDTVSSINNLAQITHANFGELFKWLGNLPDFMNHLKKQMVNEIAQTITANGGTIQFHHSLPDLTTEQGRLELDERSKRQQKQISDLLNLE